MPMSRRPRRDWLGSSTSPPLMTRSNLSAAPGAPCAEAGPNPAAVAIETEAAPVRNSRRDASNIAALRVATSFLHVLVEEGRDLGEDLLRLRRRVVAQVMRVRLALVDLQRGFDPGLPQLAMDPHRVRQKEVARAARQDGGREARHVAVDRREQRVLHVLAVGVDLGARVAEAVARDERVVD